MKDPHLLFFSRTWTHSNFKHINNIHNKRNVSIWLLFPAHYEVEYTDVQPGVCSMDLSGLAYIDTCVENKQALLQIAHECSDTVLKRCERHCAITFTHWLLTHMSGLSLHLTDQNVHIQDDLTACPVTLVRHRLREGRDGCHIVCPLWSVFWGEEVKCKYRSYRS